MIESHAAPAQSVAPTKRKPLMLSIPRDIPSSVPFSAIAKKSRVEENEAQEEDPQMKNVPRRWPTLRRSGYGLVFACGLFCTYLLLYAVCVEALSHAAR